jgi:very-short-patch-repair endonuclease
MKINAAHLLLLTQIRGDGLPEPQQEYRFHPVRKWRADLAWPQQKLIVEIDGGIYSQGRHTRGKGYTADCEKLNAALVSGFHVFRFTTEMVEDGSAIEVIKHWWSKH